MNLLVTGGAGFIGSNLVDDLITLGHKVIIIDNFSRGNRANLNPEAKVYELDIRSKQIAGILQGEKVTHLLHLAAQTDVQYSLQNPVLDAFNNIMGTVNLLEACHMSGVEKFIYASSGAVYGQPLVLPITEKHPIKPVSPYGLSKYIAEEYIRLYHQLYGLKYTIFRYANVYGPHQDYNGDGGVVAIFLQRALQGKKIVIFGTGEQTRDFIYVQDIVRANIIALAQGDNEVFNLSCNLRISVNQLVDTIAWLVKTDLQPIYCPKRHGEIEHSSLDNTKAEKILHWKPEVNLLAGLQQTIQYYQNIS